jgi:Mannosyltransferase (PIG-V)
LWRSWSALRADAARVAAVRDSARALLASRLLVWAAGSGAVAAFGFGPARHVLDPPHTTRGFGWLGDLLAAPAARWDAAWYLVIAKYGYRPDLGAFTSPRAAFFPAYPLGLRSLASLGLPPVLAGTLLSLVALALALYALHRLTTLEFARVGALARSSGSRLAPARVGRRAEPAEVARLAVLVTAFAPMAFYLSAVYSESLYLALSVGCFWAARHGRFAIVGVLGALAAATRSAGVLLLLPAIVLYLYGPREDRAADAVDARGLRPRYRLRADALWLLLIPAGVGAFMLYLGLAGGDPLAPFAAQDVWSRHFAGPYLATWDGLQAAFEGARQLLSFQVHHVYFHDTVGSPSVAAEHNLLLLGFLLAAAPAVVGVWRTLPAAYGLYVLAALALPLSDPVSSQPLMSLPRFLLVLFPLSMWFGAWLAERPRVRRPALAASALLLALFAAQFATWHWVA